MPNGPNGERRPAAEKLANLNNRLTRIEIMLGASMALQIPMTIIILTTLLGSK